MIDGTEGANPDLVCTFSLKKKSELIAVDEEG